MNKGTIKKVLNYIGKYKIFLGLSVLFAALSVVLTLYVPILIGKAIDYIIEAGRVDFDKMAPILIKAMIAVGITSFLQWLMNVCNNKITYNVVRDIRKEAMRKIERLPLKYIDSRSYGEIVSRVVADVDTFSEGLLMGFTQFFTGVVTIFGTLIFMLTINVRITLVVVIVTPVSLFVARFIASKTFSMFKLQSEIRGEQTAFIDEMIGNLKVVQAYTHEDENMEKFDDINERL